LESLWYCETDKREWKVVVKGGIGKLADGIGKQNAVFGRWDAVFGRWDAVFGRWGRKAVDTLPNAVP